MDTETRWSYQKKIRELERENSKLKDDLYQFRTASSEIYDGVMQVIEQRALDIPCLWVLKRLKRAWRN